MNMNTDFENLIQSYLNSGRSNNDIADSFTSALNKVEKEHRERNKKQEQTEVAKMRAVIDTKMKEAKYDTDFLSSAMTLYFLAVSSKYEEENDEPIGAADIKDLYNTAKEMVEKCTALFNNMFELFDGYSELEDSDKKTILNFLSLI